MHKTSYIFFEPINNDFFHLVAKAYGELYVNTVIDATQSLYTFYKPYACEQPYPANHVDGRDDTACAGSGDSKGL
jgi:hypothetical protein